MFNVGGGELLVILLVALIVLGPQRLPDAARQVGRVMGDIRRISGGFQQELKDAFDTGDEPARRTEPVPLAKAVADADDTPAEPGDGADPGPRLREVDAAGDASSVAPAVATRSTRSWHRRGPHRSTRAADESAARASAANVPRRSGARCGAAAGESRHR